MKVTITPVENSEVEIVGELAADKFSTYHQQAITNLNQEAKIDGFRPGHVPEGVLIEKLGEEAILLEMADLALREIYPEIVIENKIDALGRPNIQITKIAKDNPLGFKITTAVHPEVKLGDYLKAVKKVLADHQPTDGAVITVTEEEVAKVIEEVRQNYAHHEHHKANPEDTNHDHGELPLPEINDEFATKVGPFADLASLKEKIKANLTAEKEREVANKKRVNIIEALHTVATVTPPAILIEHELDTMIGELASRIEQAGLKFDDYLKHLGKTEAEVRDGWKEEAAKQVKTGLFINEIAKAEKIEPDADQVLVETEKLMTNYQDINPDRARDYVSSMLTNQKVFEFLERLK